MNRPNFIKKRKERKKRLAEGLSCPNNPPSNHKLFNPNGRKKPSFSAGSSMSQHQWQEVDCNLHTRQTRGDPQVTSIRLHESQDYRLWPPHKTDKERPSSHIYPTTWVPRLRSVMMREDGASSNTPRMCSGAKASSNTPRRCIEAKAYAKFERETTRVSKISSKRVE